jgi:BirA family transcriptional regulator, biotin operon repressor / biotin---[acetyl-CoA-carboxylase] ligase
LQPAPNRIGSTLIELQQVDSTNNYATGLIHAGMAQHGIVVTAKEQTSGKGQRNRSWEAVPGENITLSVIIEPNDLVLAEAFLLSMAVAVACRRFFSAYAGPDTRIKWPNDIYWNDRKAGGILIENILSGTKWKYAVAGIGININQVKFGESTGKPVSLKQITGKDFEIQQLISELLDHLEDCFTELVKHKELVTAEYHLHLYKSGEEVRFKKANRSFRAIVKGVTDHGRLILLHGIEHSYEIGEIEWII